jgi:hypothetical protein
MNTMGGLQAFRIKKGEYLEIDFSIGNNSNIRKTASDGFVYSVIKLHNGFVFSQNQKITGRKSFLFLNTEKFSLKEISGNQE